MRGAGWERLRGRPERNGDGAMEREATRWAGAYGDGDLGGASGKSLVVPGLGAFAISTI